METSLEIIDATIKEKEAQLQVLYELRKKILNSLPSEPYRNTFPANYKSTALDKAAYPRSGAPWTFAEDTNVAKLFNDGLSPKQIAHVVGRTRGAILSRLKHLGLVHFDPVSFQYVRNPQKQ